MTPTANTEVADTSERTPTTIKPIAPAITAQRTIRRQRVAGVVKMYQGGRQRLTPAMQAGVTNELWTMDRLYDEVMA